MRESRELVRLPLPARQLLEKDIAPLVVQYAHSLGDMQVVREMGVSNQKSRIDVAAMAPGLLCGFEIKSDADSHSRFLTQSADWNHIFNRLSLVVTKKHMKAILDPSKTRTWRRMPAIISSPIPLRSNTNA